MQWGQHTATKCICELACVLGRGILDFYVFTARMRVLIPEIVCNTEMQFFTCPTAHCFDWNSFEIVDIHTSNKFIGLPRLLVT